MRENMYVWVAKHTTKQILIVIPHVEQAVYVILFSLL